MEKFEFLNAYIAATLNKMPDEWGEPRTFTGLQVVEILWPLNDFFRTQLTANLNVAYQAQYEQQADEAIMAYIMEGSDAWHSLPAGVWRVLLERHLQSLMVASANELNNPNFFTMPKALPEASLLGAAMIYLMYQMKPPFAVKPLTAGALPPIGSAAKPLLH